MIKPTIHINGDSAETLTEGYSRAMIAIQRAIDALTNVHPHARNYYTQGDGVWQKAVAEQWERVNALEKVFKEVEELAMHCADARK